MKKDNVKSQLEKEIFESSQSLISDIESAKRNVIFYYF